MKPEDALVIHVSDNDEGLDDFCDYLAALMTEKKWRIEKIQSKAELVTRFDTRKFFCQYIVRQHYYY